MPFKLYKRKTRNGGFVWWYDGTVAGHRLRASTRTKEKDIAARIASEVEHRAYKRNLDGPQEVLTFPQAVALYIKAGKLTTERERRYVEKIEDYWKDTKVKDMKAGAILQSAIDIHPMDTAATRNRQVITPTQAIINNCARLELCSPIRIERFKGERKIKQPVTLEWLDTFCAHARPLTAALATFMFATACRISEAMRLEWADIDFQQRTILVVKTKNKKQRLPHMPQRLLVALANLPRDDKPFGCWSESMLRRFWDEDVAKAIKAVPEFSRLTFHSCRHGFATKLLRDGVDVRTVADLAGMTVPVLLETYAHALQKPQLTEGLFGTPAVRESGASKKINGLE